MTQSFQLSNYRNGLYHGHLKENKRNGKGILITDDGEIIVGQWKNDKLHGIAIVIMSPNEYSVGEWNRGELQGWSLFQSEEKILVGQFNADRTINMQVLIQKGEASYKVIQPTQSTHSIYETVSQHSLQKQEKLLSLPQIISNELKPVNLPSFLSNNSSSNGFSRSLIEHLNNFIQQNKEEFQIETLPNGYFLFKLKDQTSVVSVGFVLNKNNILISYGTYINQKLNGLCCKFQSGVRYEGVFQNGYLNGQGLKFSAGKYSYGIWQNGQLVNPTYLEQRSLASEQKLKELKKLLHLSSMTYRNIYLPHPFFKFKGIKEIVFELNIRPQIQLVSRLLQQNSKSSTKKPQNNIATKLFNLSKQENQSKSVVSISNVSNRKFNQSNERNNLNYNKNIEQTQSRVSQGARSVTSVRRFQNGN